MNMELAIHNLTEQVRLLTDRLDKLESRMSVPGGLNDAEPMKFGDDPTLPGFTSNDAEPQSPKIWPRKYWDRTKAEMLADAEELRRTDRAEEADRIIDAVNQIDAMRGSMIPQTLGHAATAGCEWEDVKGEQTTRRCDRPPGI